jgi:hypothetical protein
MARRLGSARTSNADFISSIYRVRYILVKADRAEISVVPPIGIVKPWLDVNGALRMSICLGRRLNLSRLRPG